MTESFIDPLNLLSRVEGLEAVLGVDLIPSDIDLLPVVPRVLYLEEVIRDTHTSVIAMDRLAQSAINLRDVIEQVSTNTAQLIEIDNRVAKTDQKTNFLATNAERRQAKVESEFRRNRRVYATLALLTVLVAALSGFFIYREHSAATTVQDQRKVSVRTSYLNCLATNKTYTGIDGFLSVETSQATSPEVRQAASGLLASLPPLQNCRTAYALLQTLGVHDIPSP